MQSRTLRKYLGLSASVLLLAGNSAWAAQTLEYSIRWDTKDDRYHVFMKPTVTPSPRDMSLTGQITIRVPHATGADAFVVDDPKSVVANTSWSNNSRVDAPEEDTSVDYISFSLSVIQSSAFAWQAGEEKEVLNFRNSATCIGPVSLINNDTDPFNAPLLTGGQNSAHTNPGNQFTNLGWGGSTENNYLDNYGANSANCEDSLDSDGDGLKDGDENALGLDPLKADTDGDGVGDQAEVGANPASPTDTDADGTPDALDTDDDNDGILTSNENYNGGTPTDDDTDTDGTPDYLDTDDDGDGKPSKDESNDPNGDGSPADAVDTDGDSVPDYLDADNSDGPMADPDGDGLTNAEEVTNGSDPAKADTDGDGIPDGVEVNSSKTDPLQPDSDGDGVGDQAEVGANPASPTDTDADGTPDALDTDDDGDGKPSKDEGNDPNGDGSPADAVDTDGDSVPDYLDADNSDGPMADPDGDGLTNAEEVTNGTDPAKADTDGDGIPDGVEINTTHTDPTKADSDGDGLPDGAEVNTTHTDPVLADTDGDGLSDGVEVNTTHTDPVLADTDGDGLPDGVEVNSSKTDPLQPDSDGDGVGDQAEVGANPVSPTDTDADGTPDALDTDDDNDGVLTSNENYNGGNPAGDDTDGDQIPDYLDTDDDGDGKLSKDEGNDPNGDGSPADATDIDEDGIPDYLDTTINGIKLQLKLMLQGAYNSTTQLMQADLRGKGLIPQIQPYNRGLYQYEGTEATTSALLATTDNNAPVDWVLVELRDSTNPTTIKARLAALVQRDGDVMDAATGSTTLQVPKMVSGDYYVAIHHRNHLGVVTASAVSLNPSTATLVDFTKTSTAVWGSNARIMSGGNAMLWAGNANLDTRIIANGPSNDTGVIMGSLLMDPANLSVSSNYQLAGYQDTDINMDGLSIFAGPSNDVNLLLGNILLHPGNNTFSANYIISRQMP